MKSGTWICVAIIAAASLLFSCNKNDNNDNSNAVSQSDIDFVKMASMSNFAEISAGQIAAQRGSDSVASFGQMMVTEHTATGQQMKSLAGNLGITVNDSLDDQHQQLMDSLMNLNGTMFDSVYLASQVADHQAAITLFQNEIDGGQNQDLKDFATNTMPHLQMHLQKADSLVANMNTNH
jgi:putative membrane protein